MHSKFNIHNFWRSHTFIILVFVVMSIMSGALMYHTHFIGTEIDLNFHLQRIYELRDSIFNGNFLPLVSLNHFNQSGSAVMSMYPSLNLLPVVLLSFLIKSSVTLFNVTFIIGNFARFLIAYFASFNFNKDRKTSFIFSTTYVLSITSLYYYFGVSAPGTLSVISYLPLVLFGSLALLKDNKWIELSLGMSLIIFSHILSVGITILFVVAFFAINIQSFKDSKKIKSLIKSVVVTALVTSVFWIPFLITTLNNDLRIPTITSINGTNLFELVYNPIGNVVTDTITLAGLIGLMLSAVFYKKLSYYSKQLFWIAILYLIVASDLFPWDIAVHTFIRHLQFPHRLYIIPQVILCYLLAECLVILMKNIKRQEFILILVCFVPLVTQMFAQGKLASNYYKDPELYTNKYVINRVVKNNDEFKNILNDEKGNKNTMDYYPEASVHMFNNIIHHVAIYSNKHLSVTVHGDGNFAFTNKKDIKNLSLPFLYYNSIDYQVKLDGKTVNGYANKHALMTINNVSKGKHHVQIIVHKTKAEIASYVLSFVGFVILLGTLLKDVLKNTIFNIKIGD